MNPETVNIIYDIYDHLPQSQYDNGVESLNDILNILETGIVTLNPGPVWSELDQCEDFVDLISTIALYCGIEATQVLAIYCLDRGLSNCQMEFYDEIYEQYLCSEVLTYKRLIA